MQQLMIKNSMAQNNCYPTKRLLFDSDNDLLIIQQLKTMYYQRRNHKLKEWHTFCDWCLTLPHFTDFVIKKDIL